MIATFNPKSRDGEALLPLWEQGRFAKLKEVVRRLDFFMICLSLITLVGAGASWSIPWAYVRWPVVIILLLFFLLWAASSFPHNIQFQRAGLTVRYQVLGEKQNVRPVHERASEPMGGDAECEAEALAG